MQSYAVIKPVPRRFHCHAFSSSIRGGVHFAWVIFRLFTGEDQDDEDEDEDEDDYDDNDE